MELIDLLRGVLERKKELEERQRELLEKMRELTPQSGSLEYKPVRNKIGRTYYYWYLRVWSGDKLKSIYLGKTIPPKVLKGIADRKMLKQLESELKEVNAELVRINNALVDVWRILSSI